MDVCKKKKNAKPEKKSNLKTDEGEKGESARLWRAHFDICRVLSLFTLEINRWKVKENKWEERRERGRARAAVCHAERGIFTSGVFQKPHFSMSSHLAPSGQLWQGNTLDLIWFVLVVSEMLQLWETGGWWSSGAAFFISLSSSYPALIFFSWFYSFSTCSAAPPPTLVSSFMPYSIIPCS